MIETAPTPREIAVAAVAAGQLARNWRFDGYAALCGANRAKDLMALRLAVARVLRRRNWTVALIGALLDRHYTTILHALEWRDYPYYDGIEDLEDEYAGLMDAAILPEGWRDLVQKIQTRAAGDINSGRSHQAVRPWAQRPAGMVSPGALARRWQVPTGTVRYWIARGVLTAQRTADGRLWLAPDTVLPASADLTRSEAQGVG